MFLEILDFLIAINSGFAVLGYLTTRVAFTLITALLIMLVFGNRFINIIQKMQLRQVVRTDGPESHLKKNGTPTMGGILILISFLVSSLLWGNFNNKYLWVVLFTILIFAVVGFIDDYLKIAKQNSRGLSIRQKITLQIIGAIITTFMLIYAGLETNYLVPFVKNYYVELGVITFFLIAVFLIVGFSNGVNLTDGLDGLAIMPTVIIASGLAVFAYISSNYNFATHLNMEYMPRSTEMLIVLAALIGAGLGFLWFNAYPAQIFMGDVGSLSIGATLVTIAIILRQEIVFVCMGLVFVIEALSVMLQVGYFKYSGGKRIFLMAPIHHHFEKKGMSEPKIIIRAWLITVVLVLIALATIKIR